MVHLGASISFPKPSCLGGVFRFGLPFKPTHKGCPKRNTHTHTHTHIHTKATIGLASMVAIESRDTVSRWLTWVTCVLNAGYDFGSRLTWPNTGYPLVSRQHPGNCQKGHPPKKRHQLETPLHDNMEPGGSSTSGG